MHPSIPCHAYGCIAILLVTVSLVSLNDQVMTEAVHPMDMTKEALLRELPRLGRFCRLRLLFVLLVLP